ncbi:MAG: hypothetical protein HN888_10550 [Desulfobacula sp.]|nr:hypothetical protein [Desulfobacula sp.]
MKTYQKCFNPPKLFFIMALMLCLYAAPCLSAIPGWDNVPKTLKHSPGIEISNGLVYATGVSCIDNIRPDKAHEIAKKKSLLRALQIASLFGSCKVENPGWSKKDQLHFYQIFAPLAKKVEFHGTQVIRQWEKKDCQYTTISLPKQEIEKRPCEFSDIKTAVSKYIEHGNYTDEGLLFCLKNTDRYSLQRRKVEIALKKLLIAYGREDVAVCLPGNVDKQKDNVLIKPFIIRNNTYRANKIVDKVQQKLMQKGDLSNLTAWNGSLVELINAQKLSPDNTRPYLLLAEWANTSLSPVVAQYGAEKAMRDGTQLKQALTQKVNYLKAAGSEETQVFELLLSQMEKTPEKALFLVWSETWLKSWNQALRILEDFPVANLVAVSLGQVIRSKPKKPSIEFTEALSLYKKSESEKDLVRVLKLLFKACEKEPASPEVYNLIGSCFRHMDQYEIALPFLWQALVLKPGFDLALTNLGLCCEKLNLLKSAGYYFNHDIVVNSTNKWVNSSYAKFISREKE